MAFKAQGSVSRLDWDFNPYVAAKGTSPEPSGTAIGDYWADYLSMLRQSQQNVQEMQDKRNAAETVEEKRADWRSSGCSLLSCEARPSLLAGGMGRTSLVSAENVHGTVDHLPQRRQKGGED
jgi:hypothetical protein